MEKNRASISVIMPVYNGEPFLRETIESVQAQTLCPFEIIIVDDGSTDRTAEIAKGFGAPVRYFYQPNSGPSAARNRGIAQARGGLIALLDVDDRWSEKKLELQSVILAEEPSVEVVFGHTQVVVLKDNVYEEFAKPFFSFVNGCALHRRSAYEKVGLFDEEMRFGEDCDWFMRAREIGLSIKVHPEVVLNYRLHDLNMTRGKNALELNVVRALKMSLERRRMREQGTAAPLPRIDGYGGPLPDGSKAKTKG